MSISVKSILANLDSEQIKAVKTLDGPLYILAGAGAGKTRTITHRIAYAVKSNYWSVNSILATTFTVKAALEMKDRLEKLEVSGVTVNTFHGVALEILKTNWQIITSAPFPELMDNRLSFLESICKSNSYNLSNIQIMAISDEISWMKTSLVPVEQYKESLSWNNHEALDFINTEEFLYIFDCYETIKSQNNRIDFEDILLIMAHGIERYPQLDNKVRGRYRHFIVDEFQDISPLQYYVLRMWMGSSPDICVVGDPSQTIYSFAGASCYYLNNFNKLFRGSKLVKILKNYRSDSSIVELANKVLARKRNKAYTQLKLKSPYNKTQMADFATYYNEVDEANQIINKISQLFKSGCKLSDIAVLYRARYQVRNIIELANKKQLPYIEKDGQNFFDNSIIELIMDGLYKNKSYFNMINISNNLYVKNFQDRLKKQVFESIELKGQKDKIKNNILARGFIDLANRYLSQSTKSNEVISLDGFFLYVKKLRDLEIEPQLDCVTFSSIHSAKGLEYPIVFLPAVIDGNIPIILANSKDEIEEERRLLYVAITRAEKKLFISYSRVWNNKKTSPSRFFEKIWPVK